MEVIVYSLVGCLLLLGCFYLGLRLVNSYFDYKKNKFKTDTAHFLSDLYKLKVKWSDLGQMGYVESLDGLIRFHGLVDKKPRLGGVGMPITNDSLSTDIQLKNQRKEELLGVLREQGILDEEFIG